ncbi:MAG: GNAT family N-acetyltransferase [Verrucomicrobiaceae bacterium]|nr:GNAT family N-acetyltransferase [Verrucomicrobiaceae bacterium]
MEIRIATSLEEKQAIYELRYACYVEELGWHYQHADTARHHLRDAADDHATLYYAECDGKVIATCRLHFGDIMIDEVTRERFGLHRFIDHCPPSACAFIFRLVVAPEHRGSTVMIRLLTRCYEDGWRHGIRFSFCWCRPRLVEIYERLGFLRYKENISGTAQGYVTPMVMLNEDAEHLHRVRSPFLRVCRAHTPSMKAAEWFDLTFPEARTSSVRHTVEVDELMRQWSARMQEGDMMLLNGFTPQQTQSLLQAGTVLQLRAGDLIIQENEAGHEMFLVLEGVLSLTCSQIEGGQKEIARLGSGQIFGELALVSKARRNASVQAITNAKVLVISREFLQRAMKALPETAILFLYNLCQVLAGKLRDTTDWLLATQKTPEPLNTTS